MKNLLLTTVIVGALLTGNETKAQLGFNFSIHLGNRPAWGVPGNVRANYYYMPEIDCYYDLAAQQFIYEDGGRWICGTNLPYWYRDYNLNTGYKVIVNEPRPYLRGDFYRQQYRNRYNTFRRNDDYARRDMRPDFRNDDRYRNDNRMDRRFEGPGMADPRRDDRRGFDDRRMDDRRMDDRRNAPIDNRNGQNNGFDQPRRDDRFNNDRMDIRGPQPGAINNNNGNNQRDERGGDNRGPNGGQYNGGQNNGGMNNGNDNRPSVPGQPRMAQRRPDML